VPTQPQQIAVDTVFEPVRTRKTFEDVTRQILEAIRSGELQAGDALPGERRLAALMEVSRPTVRAAIGVLADAGVVEVTPGRAGGISIASIWIPDELIPPAEALAADEAFALLEARRALEPQVAQLAAMRGTDAIFAAMEDTIELQQANATHHRRALQAEVMFHRLMWKASENRPLEQMLRQLFERLETVFDMAMRTESDTANAVGLRPRPSPRYVAVIPRTLPR
jgi:GntR family transcriptional regulator, transcriptional repressor for pyruvate dehydrogenase complex